MTVIDLADDNWELILELLDAAKEDESIALGEADVVLAADSAQAIRDQGGFGDGR